MKFFDVIVPKEFEVTKDGKTEKRTKWNRVGRVWPSKASEGWQMELFVFPGHCYFIPMKDRPNDTPSLEEAPF